MQKLDKIHDAELRSRLTEAHQQLRSNQPTDAVRSLADTFLWMLKAKPELLGETVAARAGRRLPLVMRWPALGANLSRESVEAKDPKISFIRDHFAMSEAITYYEFTIDTAIDQGM
jgi:hypothetical protein